MWTILNQYYFGGISHAIIKRNIFRWLHLFFFIVFLGVFLCVHLQIRIESP